MKCFAAIPFLLILCSLAHAELQPVDYVLGPVKFREGDSIVIESVEASSPDFVTGDTVLVHGKYTLESQPEASLMLSLTSSKKDPIEILPEQKADIRKGSGEFSLKILIPASGQLHVSFYSKTTGFSFGGVYFGTEEQMHAIRHWTLDWYLKD